MNMHTFKHILPAAALLCAGVAWAQPPRGGTVSLDSCRRMALRYNKQLRMTDRSIESAGYLHDVA